MLKRCPHCKKKKKTSCFHLAAGKKARKRHLLSWCKDCRNWQSSDWKRRHPERTRELSRRSARAFFIRNPERVRANASASVIRRLKTDPEFRLLHLLRGRIRSALKRNSKASSTVSLLGCSIQQLRRHLEIQFEPGMNWQNHGDWHIDHKRPCSSFDMFDPNHQKACFHWSNLQPLWARDNQIKSNKLNFSGSSVRSARREGGALIVNLATETLVKSR